VNANELEKIVDNRHAITMPKLKIIDYFRPYLSEIRGTIKLDNVQPAKYMLPNEPS
jgi:hypothetical protein